MFQLKMLRSIFCYILCMFTMIYRMPSGCHSVPRKRFIFLTKERSQQLVWIGQASWYAHTIGGYMKGQKRNSTPKTAILDRYAHLLPLLVLNNIFECKKSQRIHFLTISKYIPTKYFADTWADWAMISNRPK